MMCVCIYVLFFYCTRFIEEKLFHAHEQVSSYSNCQVCMCGPQGLSSFCLVIMSLATLTILRCYTLLHGSKFLGAEEGRLEIQLRSMQLELHGDLGFDGRS